VFKTLTFNASAAVFHEMMYCLSCFFCSEVYGFTVRICSTNKVEQMIAGVIQFIRGLHSPRYLPEIPANLMVRGVLKGCSHLRNMGVCIQMGVGDVRGCSGMPTESD